MDGWELSLNKEVYEYGDELIARLVNSTNEDRSIGDKGNIDIQYNNDGWNTIFGKPVGEEQPDPLILIEVEPGGEIEWKLTLNEDSLSELDVAAPFTLRLCQKLKSGEYRFVYWDLMDSDDAIGVRFTIEGI